MIIDLRLDAATSCFFTYFLICIFKSAQYFIGTLRFNDQFERGGLDAVSSFVERTTPSV